MREISGQRARDRHVFKPSPVRNASKAEVADPITTEIVRHALNSAARQMKRALMRTAFSPTIYAQSDFAIALYDPHFQMLAQAPSLPSFMGTMSFCVEAAVDGVGGREALEDGDVIIYNWPYGTGSHAQDAALVQPVFFEGRLSGFAACKAHLRDIAAKDAYCTDTIDVFQEGTIFPGVKLYQAGVRNESIHKVLLANSRAPRAVAGDVQAAATCVNIGATELRNIVARFGAETFWRCVDRIYAHGEAGVRRFFENIPDGRYVGRGSFDSDGINDELVSFEVWIEIAGSTVRVDYSSAPDAVKGPINCPLPSTVSATRVAIATLAGGGVAPNEGHFRAIEVITRPGSIFHPVAPQPCFLYGASLNQAMDAIFRALAGSFPEAIAAGSAGGICAVQLYARDETTGDLIKMNCPLPVGQGAARHRDGGTMFELAIANSRLISMELEEAKHPIRFEMMEYLPDSAGVGRQRGGMGWERRIRVLRDVQIVSLLERTKRGAWSLDGGGEGAPTSCEVVYPDGRRQIFRKATWVPIPAGSLFSIKAGGGGGHGRAAERSSAAVAADYAEGLITREQVASTYPHAVDALDLNERTDTTEQLT